MCGIIGFIRGAGNVGRFNDSYKNLLAQGMLAGSVRGMDGAGIAVVSQSGLVRNFRLPLPGPDFIRTKVGNMAIDASSNASVVIGHHRAATRGVHSVENTHPFRHGSGNKLIVGVHNGVIRNAPITEDGIDFDVDSDWAIYRLLKEGTAACAKFDGSYSFVYYLSEDKTVNFISNEDRPLHFAFVEDENALIYASEIKMLEWLMARNHLRIGNYKEFKAKEVDCEAYVVTKEKGYKFKLDNLRGYEQFDFPRYAPPKPTTPNYGAHGGYGTNHGYGRRNTWQGGDDWDETDFNYGGDEDTDDATKSHGTTTGASSGATSQAGGTVVGKPSSNTPQLGGPVLAPGSNGGACFPYERVKARDLHVENEWGTFHISWYDKKIKTMYGDFHFANENAKMRAKVLNVDKTDIKKWHKSIKGNGVAKDLYCELLGVQVAKGANKRPYVLAVVDKPLYPAESN